MLILLLLFFGLEFEYPSRHVLIFDEAEVHRIGDDSKHKGMLIQQSNANARLAQQTGQRKTADLILRLGETKEE